MNHPAIWSGIDVAKDSFDASLVFAEHSPQNFSKIPTQSFPRSLEGAQSFVNWLNLQLGLRCPRPEEDPRVRVLMEATGRYSLELAAWLSSIKASLKPAIINPYQAKAFLDSLNLRNKTDRMDCRALGLMGKERRPQPYQGLEPVVEELRELTRQRSALVNALKAERLRAQEPRTCPSVKRLQSAHIKLLTKLVAQAETAMKQLISRHPRLNRDVRLAMTIPGVGFLTAAVVLGELGDLRRFKRSRQVSAMAGVSPQQRQSGKTRGRTVLSKFGNRRVRGALYLAALATVRKTPPRKLSKLAKDYLRLVRAGKHKRAALGAIMRKILVIMRALLIHEQPYSNKGPIPVEKVSKKYPQLRFVPKF